MAKTKTKPVTLPEPKGWPARKIDMRSIHDLEPYARNARTHSPEQVRQIAASIRRFGWTIPVLIDENDGIIAGHGRVLAAALEGIEDVPCMVATGWSDEQKRAYVIADNKLALNSGWDDQLLREEIAALDELGFGASDLGFSDAEMAALFAPTEETDPLAEWKGMPEFVQNDKEAFKTVALHFKDQEAVERFAELIGQTITPKTRFIWYPQIEIETYADKEYGT